MKSKKIILLIIPLFLSGCVGQGKKYSDIYQPMPIEPQWENYTKPPVIKKEKDNFLVTDEFVKKSIQQKRYIDKIKMWRLINNIP